jgi:DNA-binding Xre family transcriptional regulator
MTEIDHLLAASTDMPEPPRMIIGPQIRAGRALLDWSVAELSDKSGISEATIRRAETAEGVPTIRADNLNEIQRALEDGGVMFLEAADVRPGGPGVRIREA